MGEFCSLRRVIVWLSDLRVDTSFILTLLCGSAMTRLVFNCGVVGEGLGVAL